MDKVCVRKKGHDDFDVNSSMSAFSDRAHSKAFTSILVQRADLPMLKISALKFRTFLWGLGAMKYCGLDGANGVDP